MSRISFSRPIRGHVNRMRKRVKQQLRAPQDNSCLAIPDVLRGRVRSLPSKIRHWAKWCVSVGTQVVDAGENSRDQ